MFLCKLEDMPDADGLKNVFLLKATEDYVLGFHTPKEKTQWVLHYRELCRQATPRKGILFFFSLWYWLDYACISFKPCNALK